MNQERLNAPAVLSTEKMFYASHSVIKEKVVNLFAQSKTKRMDFIFRLKDQAELELSTFK